MGRFENSNELFGRGYGQSTCGDFVCNFCGTKWNEGNDESEYYDGDSISYTNFAGLIVCFNCFEEIEKEILCRMPDILVWYRKILNERREHVEAAESMLSGLEGGEDG